MYRILLEIQKILHIPDAYWKLEAQAIEKVREVESLKSLP